MLGASNDFYNFVVDSFRVFKKDDRTTLKAAWEMYKVYCEDARVPYPFSQRTFKEELKNYFREFTETFNDGSGSRNVYSGFRSDIFEKKVKEVRDDDKSRRASWIKLEKSEVGKIGPFEDLCSDAPAQYANSDETPRKGWTKVKTKLKDLNVSKLHYVKVPEWLIVIDFDLKDEDGNKSLEKNLEAASKWPATYAEVSKGGAGLHLHYIYNHMLYACMLGYDNQQIYELSQHIINTKKGEKKKYTFGEAYNLSYTDVYDFASAGNKKSLKKLEIEMSNVANDPKSKMDDDLREMLKGIKHHELGLPWDQPVPESRWQEVAEYCDDDVIATEAGFYYLKSDWTARQILADLAGMSVNDTTNTLTTKFIFGNNKNPQNEFHYRNLAEPVLDLDEDTYQFLAEACPEMMSQTHGEAGSLLPYFPGYRYENGVSIYRGEEVGEGGYVYAEPGTYGNVALLDIASMHPHSTIAEG